MELVHVLLVELCGFWAQAGTTAAELQVRRSCEPSRSRLDVVMDAHERAQGLAMEQSPGDGGSERWAPAGSITGPRE